MICIIIERSFLIQFQAKGMDSIYIIKGKTVIVDPIFYFIVIFQVYFYRFRYGIWTDI